MSFGITPDKGPGAARDMADPWTGQRRTPPNVAFEPIQDKLMRKYGPRTARGDLRPIHGNIQLMPDGSPGGVPIPRETLMAPLASHPMMRRTPASHRGRTEAETRIQAARFLQKPKMTLLQLGEPSAREAAASLRGRPGDPFMGKPAPPVDFQGGFTRVFERNRAYPKDTSLSMRPIAPVGISWGISLPTYSDYSAPSNLPKTR